MRYIAKRILIPMDFSEEAMLAWDWAMMLGKDSGDATLFPTYVYSLIPDPVSLDVGQGEYNKVTQEWIESKMEVLQKKLSKRLFCHPLYANGSPAKEIIKLCHLKKIELIITTTHGRQGISHLLHRNVSEALAQSAPCPVLVLHMNRLMQEPVQTTPR